MATLSRKVSYIIGGNEWDASKSRSFREAKDWQAGPTEREQHNKVGGGGLLRPDPNDNPRTYIVVLLILLLRT